ncbi:MAG: hypothetical protein LLG04_10920 [Parachlamydia sp.]|nr:hypothetical protein [Parachlamydia sp.]
MQSPYAARTSSSGALVPAKALPPIPPKKPLPAPPASSSATQLSLEDPLLNKIAEQLAFAFHQSTEFVKRYATNLQLIQAQPQKYRHRWLL